MIIKAPDSVIIFREASEQGALFGSVTSRDVINEINSSSKLDLKAKDFTIKQTIKNIGDYSLEDYHYILKFQRYYHHC